MKHQLDLKLTEVRSLLLGLSGQFLDEAEDISEVLQRHRAEALRARPVLRLVPLPKMGFEADYHLLRNIPPDLDPSFE